MRMDQKNAYNNAISTGQTIINKTTDPVLDKTTVDEAINNISTKSQHFTVNKNYKQLKQMQQTQLTHCQISIHRKRYSEKCN